MSLGILKLRLYLPGSLSLKDKRRVVRSLTAKLRERFNVSVAEIGERNCWQIATICIACIAPDRSSIDHIFSKIKEFTLNSRLDAHLLEEEIEILPGP